VASKREAILCRPRWSEATLRGQSCTITARNMDPLAYDFWQSIGIPNWLPTLIQWLSNIGGLSFFGYLLLILFRWLKKNYLSDSEVKIIKEMFSNNYRILHKPERSDYPLHVKFDWNGTPFPSEDRLEMMKFYEIFIGLIEKGYIRLGVDEIYVLTSKGIKAARKRHNKYWRAFIESK